MEKKSKIFIIITMTIILISILTIPFSAYAEDIKMESIIGDLVNPVFDLDLTNGDILLKESVKREEINNEVSTGSLKEYSLFDRFGPDISFMPYYGEVKINVNIIDKFYSYFIKTNSDVSFTNRLKEFFSSGDYEVNNIVYENRVDISNSNQDPRYIAWQGSETAGSNGQLANFYLSISKIINEMYYLFIGGKIFESLIDFMNNIFNDEFIDIAKEIFRPIFSILIMAFIINITRKTIRYLKTASIGIKEIISKSALSFILFAIILFLVYNPLRMVVIFEKMEKIKRDVIDDSLDLVIDNDIINDSEDILRASLWYINIFDPWVKGTFKDNYENLYTMYDLGTEDRGNKRMDMSNDNILEPWHDGSLRYSAAMTIGDISVSRGNRKNVKNWAALGYSVQSKYHINSVRGPEGETSWPYSKTTAKNSNIYVDSLRLTDAIMNISEEYEALGSTTGSIPTEGPNAPKIYDSSFMIPSSIISLYRTVFLTFPIFYFSVLSFVYLLELLFYFITLIWAGCLYIINTDNKFTGFRNIGDKIISFIIVSLMQFLSSLIYMKTYQTIIGNIVFLLVSGIMMVITPSLTRREREAKNYIKYKAKALGSIVTIYGNKTSNKIKEKVRREKEEKQEKDDEIKKQKLRSYNEENEKDEDENLNEEKQIKKYIEDGNSLNINIEIGSKEKDNDIVDD